MIQVTDLVKKFKDFSAVDHISFAVEKGKVFAFLGPNGAGKTTTIKMLTTILQPTSGSLRVGGHDPVAEPNQVRRAFGIVFQDQSVDGELTAHENLELHGVFYGMPKALRRERGAQMLELVELADRRDDYLKTFSGGMKRRFEIARALMHQPQIIFLDEPTLGLDPQTRNRIWEYLRLLNREQQITVFFTTHYMEEADRVADEIAVIDHGRIIAQGPPQKLKDDAQAKTLEDAFIALTGRAIRAEESSAAENMRAMSKAWGRR